MSLDEKIKTWQDMNNKEGRWLSSLNDIDPISIASGSDNNGDDMRCDVQCT